MINTIRWRIHFCASYFRSFSMNPRAKAYFKWISEKAERRRYEFNHLDANSIVFDVGGYLGEFAEKIFQMYGSKIFLFEPIRTHVEVCKIKFLNNPKISIYPFGLSNCDQTVDFSDERNASSINVVDVNKTIKVSLKSVNDFIKDNEISKIDVMKINIEGGEYELLDSLIQSGNIYKIQHLQIQFHDFTNTMRERKVEIVNKLKKLIIVFILMNLFGTVGF